MKTTCTFKIHWGAWNDPGDYPNSLAGGPIASVPYPEEINGEFTVELDKGDAMPTREELTALAQDECPVDVILWHCRYPYDGCRVILTVEEFDPNSVEVDAVTFDNRHW